MVGSSEVGCQEDSKMEYNTQGGKDDGCIDKDLIEGTPFEEFEEQEQQDLLEQVQEGNIRHSTDNFLLVDLGQ